jgi:hypothetical protein
MSAFLWLDYSEKERRKMLDVVNSFRERDTRDELGLGSVRDAFADMLFPGTSTIMTRARYFLLVPWTYQRLERLRISSAQIAERARRAETDLIEVLEHSEDNDGNIGKLAKTTLKRLPSSVYWQGLGVWGIRNFQESQSQYHRGLDRYYTQITRHGGRASERDAEHDDLIAPSWHGGLVPPPTEFTKECSLTMTHREAEYVAERIRLSPACFGSLLAELVAKEANIASIPFVWHHPHLADLPPKLAQMVSHAQNFSEVMHGAPLLYNLILSEEARWDDGVNDYRQRLSDWEKSLLKRFHILAEWKRVRFWELIRAVNPRISNPTYEFINTWWDLALTDGTRGLSESPFARSLVRERERRLKKTLARIGNPRAQELWNGDSGSAQLDFRWLISQRLLGDIFSGLDTADA